MQNSDHVVLCRVLVVVRDVLDVPEEETTPTSDFRNDLAADSLDMVSLVWALEEEFGGKIEDGVLEALRTPLDVANYISTQMDLDQ